MLFQKIRCPVLKLPQLVIVANFKEPVTSPAVPFPTSITPPESLDNPVSPFQLYTVPLGNCKEFDIVIGLVEVPAVAGAVIVTLPLVDPVKAKIPLLVPAKPTVKVGAEKVNWVLVRGAVPEPPPRTIPPEASRAEVVHAEVLEK